MSWYKTHCFIRRTYRSPMGSSDKVSSNVEIVACVCVENVKDICSKVPNHFLNQRLLSSLTHKCVSRQPSLTLFIARWNFDEVFIEPWRKRQLLILYACLPKKIFALHIARWSINIPRAKLKLNNYVCMLGRQIIWTIDMDVINKP